MKDPNIQPGDVLEWDFGNPFERDDQYVHAVGSGPFICLRVDRKLSDTFIHLEHHPEPGYYQERFKVNAFLTAVRRAKNGG